MPSESIGIVYTKRRGEAIAMHFAKHGFPVLLFEIDRERAAGYLNGSKKTLEIMGLRGNLTQVPIDPTHMRWVSSTSELENCDLLIEAIHDSKPEKIKYAKKLFALAKPDTPVMSHSYLSMPSELSIGWDDNSNFVVGYFYDVEYAATNVELVYHRSTRPEMLDKAKRILTQGGFLAYAMLECPGFIHNRVGCLGITSLFRFYDQKILSFKHLGQYFIVSRFVPYILDIPLATEIETELFDLLPLVEKLNQHYGARYYIPAFFQEDLTKENLADIIAAHSADYVVEEPVVNPQDRRNISSVYITGIDLIHNNVLYALANRNLKLFLDARDLCYLELLKGQNPKMFQRCAEKIAVVEKTTGDGILSVDLVMDFRLEPFGQKVASLEALQHWLGKGVPILVNTPIYKIEDLACKTSNPSMIFGMYTQKNYLANTELIITPSMDISTYVRLRKFIKTISTGYIETKDSEVRPLAFMVLSKMLESVRILKEGLADMHTIDILGVDRSVFKDMDLFGLDKIVFLCDYLEPRYGDVFQIPQILSDLVTRGRTGYTAGAGFMEYS